MLKKRQTYFFVVKLCQCSARLVVFLAFIACGLRIEAQQLEPARPNSYFDRSVQADSFVTADTILSSELQVPVARYSDDKAVRHRDTSVHDRYGKQRTINAESPNQPAFGSDLTGTKAGSPIQLRRNLPEQKFELKQGNDFVGLVSKLASSTVIVLVGCVLFLFAYKRFYYGKHPHAGTHKTNNNEPIQSVFRIVQSIRLGQRNVLQLVEAEGARFVVGVDPTGIKSIVPVSSFSDLLESQEEPGSPATAGNSHHDSSTTENQSRCKSAANDLKGLGECETSTSTLRTAEQELLARLIRRGFDFENGR